MSTWNPGDMVYRIEEGTRVVRDEVWAASDSWVTTRSGLAWRTADLHRTARQALEAQEALLRADIRTRTAQVESVMRQLAELDRTTHGIA